ncbi:MAG: 2-hydroxyacyl-CoA dehydratase family protein [Desulfobacterales bacterium]|nr:2-hydroxyacyl-CoA dehydratase family protein [Desulfobacterales bacterium]
MPYESKPLKTWKMAKDLIDRHFQEIKNAKARGKILVGSAGVLPAEILSGMDVEWIFGEVYAAVNAFNWKDSPELHEACEKRGYDRNLCHYMKCYLSSLFLDKGFMGTYPKTPDFCISEGECTTHGKWMEIVSKHLNVPFFDLDHPYDIVDEAPRGEHFVDYYVSQFYEFIEWMQKVTGIKWEEEKFFEGYRNTFEVKRLWSDITNLNKAIPAPLDLKSMATLMVPAIHIYLKKEAVEFYKLLLEEVQERVEKKIAANPLEDLRFAFCSMPPWHALPDLRRMDNYGATFVAASYNFHWGTDWWEAADGTIGRPDWVGKEPRDLDEALRHVAERMLGHPLRIEAQIKTHTKIVKEYQIGALVYHGCRGCEGFLRGHDWLLKPMKELGVRCMAFEGSQADPRDYTVAQVHDRMDVFLESLGLKDHGKKEEKIKA